MTTAPEAQNKPSQKRRGSRAKSSATPTALKVLHGRVEGRLRLKVEGLYRNKKVKLRLERGLAGLSGVHSARAETRTGNLLVTFDPAIPSDMIHRSVGEILEQRHPAPRPAKRPQSAKARRAPAATPEAPDDWHLSTGAECLKRTQSRTAGLSDAEAQERLARFGPNDIPPAAARSDLSILAEQFASLPVAMLTGSAAVSLATGGIADAIATMGVVGANGLVGYFTEAQSERTIRDITGKGEHDARVIRNGREIVIPSAALVPGDILRLTPGSYISADARIISAVGLTVDESALTGESVPVSKHEEPLAETDAPLSARVNMLYRGTVIAGGTARAVVVATGEATEIGKIQRLTGEARPPATPIERELDRMSRELVLLSLGVCAGVFGLGLLRGLPTLQMLKSSIALAVAAVPEGLPTIATSTLALGLREMKERNVLIRRLDAVEGLGSINVLCFDKTGTLTANRMTVISVFAGNAYFKIEKGAFEENGHGDLLARHELKKFLEVAALCSDVVFAEHDKEIGFEGSPTEVALVELAAKGGIDVISVRDDCPREHIAYRTEARKFMATRHTRQSDGKPIVAVKGDPAQVLERCRIMEVDGQLKPLTDDDREAIIVENERMADEGLRVLGLAYTHDPDVTVREPEPLIWLGLVAMADPVRHGITDLIAKFQRAGIRTIMITGDQMATARSIARELNLNAGEPLEVIDASKMDKMPPAALAEMAQRAHVFARVSPANKLAIVRALQAAGKVVGMTGDGVNDGPALRAADVGIAMGKDGAEAARDVADVIIADDDLTTIAAGIAQGRTTYANIRKAIHFLLATNLSEILVITAETLNPADQIESPMEMFWINLVTDVLPGIGLALEPPERGVLEQPPRDPNAPMFAAPYYRVLATESAFITAPTLAAHGYGLLRYGAGPQTRSVTLMSLIAAQLLHALSCRYDRFHGVGGRDLFGNPALNKSLIAAGALQVLPLAVPPLRRLLGIAPIGLADTAVIAGAGLTSFALNEGYLAWRTANQGGSDDHVIA